MYFWTDQIHCKYNFVLSAFLLGPPSAPGLTVLSVSFEAFAFVIFPLPEAHRCVLHYNITPTSSDGNVLTDISVMARDGNQRVYS